MAIEDDDDTIDYIEEILETIADGVGVEAELRLEESDEEITAEFVGDDVARLIGHHGQTLDAIQHLAYRIAYQGVDERKPLTVDAGGYRARRAEALHAVADQAAETAIRSQRPYRSIR